MSNPPSLNSGSTIWVGRPWIVPAAIARTIAILVVGFPIVWLEFFSGTAQDAIAGVAILIWTGLVFFLIWLFSILGLLVERATNVYTLSSDSLEIQTGILTSRSFVVVASGFSDLEVIRGIAGRAFGYGDIIIRTQSERDSVKIMVKVRDSLKVADRIRYVMGRSVVRLEQPAQVQGVT
jgi:uncharacterized membrane protein YdbT with pleckstrin-like domain